MILTFLFKFFSRLFQSSNYVVNFQVDLEKKRSSRPNSLEETSAKILPSATAAAAAEPSCAPEAGGGDGSYTRAIINKFNSLGQAAP